MGRRLAIAVLALSPLLVHSSPPARCDDDPEKAVKEADAKLAEAVNRAIRQGAKWLAARQAEDGSFPSKFATRYPLGPTAISLLALLHSGVPRESAGVKKARAFLVREWDRQEAEGGAWHGHRTYSVSLAILALGDVGRGGSAKDERRVLRAMTRWLVKVQVGGCWRYPPAGGYDHSNTQYALLGLAAARAAGEKVPSRSFAKALEHLISAQEREGPETERFVEQGGDGIYATQRRRVPGSDRARGWGYYRGSECTGSMTAGGVASVAICLAALDPKGRLRERGESSVRDGLAWLGRHFTVTGNPEYGPLHHFYYLYALERAGVLARVVYTGDHRWYAKGARFLVESQLPDGSWMNGGSMDPGWGDVRGGAAPPPDLGSFGREVVDQSFALLFLARSTSRLMAATTPR